MQMFAQNLHLMQPPFIHSTNIYSVHNTECDGEMPYGYKDEEDTILKLRNL